MVLQRLLTFESLGADGTQVGSLARVHSFVNLKEENVSKPTWDSPKMTSPSNFDIFDHPSKLLSHSYVSRLKS